MSNSWEIARRGDGAPRGLADSVDAASAPAGPAGTGWTLGEATQRLGRGLLQRKLNRRASERSDVNDPDPAVQHQSEEAALAEAPLAEATAEATAPAEVADPNDQIAAVLSGDLDAAAADGASLPTADALLPTEDALPPADAALPTASAPPPTASAPPPTANAAVEARRTSAPADRGRASRPTSAPRSSAPPHRHTSRAGSPRERNAFLYLAQRFDLGERALEAAVGRFLNFDRPRAAAPPPATGPLPPAADRKLARGEILQRYYGAQGTLSPGRLSADVDGADVTDLKRRVYLRNVKRNLTTGKEFFPGLPDSEMAAIGERGHRLLRRAAGPAQALLAAARAALKAAQEAGDPHAHQVKSIGVCSSYREHPEELRLWNEYFHQYYRAKRADLAKLPGGICGDAAVNELGSYISGCKAVPGFSNHTAGRALDMMTTENGKPLTAKKSQNPAWKTTWLWQWLKVHAQEHGWTPIEEEMFHWQFLG